MMTDQFPFDNPIIPGSIWDKKSDFTVPVVSPVGAGPKGPKGDKMVFSDLSEADVDSLRKGIVNSANKSIDSLYTTTSTTTQIQIPIADYDPNFDMLFIDVNGLDLSEQDDYEISGDKVILTTPLPAGQDVHFRVLRYVIPNGDKSIVVNDNRKDYNTVAEMQADKDLEAGDICHTLGFHSAGDGGAAWYKITNHGSANGMDILDLDNDRIAELQITEDYVTPEMFGAWGDGVHDDTNAIEKAVNTGVVELGKNKTYYISFVFLDAQNFIMHGHNSKLLWIPFNPTTPTWPDGIMFTNRTEKNESIETRFGKVELTGIEFDGNYPNMQDSGTNAKPETGSILCLRCYESVIIDNCKFIDVCSDAINLMAIGETYITNNVGKNIGQCLMDGIATTKNFISWVSQYYYVAHSLNYKSDYCKVLVVKNNHVINIESMFIRPDGCPYIQISNNYAEANDLVESYFGYENYDINCIIDGNSGVFKKWFFYGYYQETTTPESNISITLSNNNIIAGSLIVMNLTSKINICGNNYTKNNQSTIAENGNLYSNEAIITGNQLNCGAQNIIIGNSIFCDNLVSNLKQIECTNSVIYNNKIVSVNTSTVFMIYATDKIILQSNIIICVGYVVKFNVSNTIDELNISENVIRGATGFIGVNSSSRTPTINNLVVLNNSKENVTYTSSNVTVVNSLIDNNC